MSLIAPLPRSAFLPGSRTKPTNNDSTNADLVAGCMTKDAEPDIRFSRTTPGSAVTVAPFAGDRGQVGMMAGGSW
jgi:hypothetical protein